MAVNENSLAPFFTGSVRQHEYVRVEDFEFVPTYVTNTHTDGSTSKYVSAYSRNLVTAHVVEQVFTFEGLSFEMAHTKISQNVKDASESSWTVPMVGSFTDGSDGSRVFEKEVVEVTREPMSPHLWRVVVMRRGTRYKVNNTNRIDPPSWASGIV